MKRFHSLYLFIGVLFASCSSIVDGLNVDPNNPTDASASLVFTGTQLANIAVQEGMASRLTTIWSGYNTGADRQWRDYFNYNVSAGIYDGDWNLVFRGANANALITIEKAASIGNNKMAGISKILQVNSLATATQLWGDIPYDEAGDIQQFPNPRFEGQLEVYGKLISRLDEAIADLETGIGTVGIEDVHFNGNETNWIGVGYTLKARLLTDLKRYGEAYQAAQNGIETYASSLYAPHGTTNGVNLNHYYSFLTLTRTGDIYAEGAHNVSLLDPGSSAYRGNAKTDETARFRFYYREEGVNTPGMIEPNTSASGFFAIDASFPLITYQENILTLAESALRSGLGFDIALEHLNTYRAFLNNGGYLHSGILNDAAPRYEPYVAADFAANGMENADGIAAEDALLREILEERYVSFYGQLLGWNDERRTRSEPYGIQLTPNIGSELPWRFIYSQNEVNSNPNVPQPLPGTFDVLPIYQ